MVDEPKLCQVMTKLAVPMPTDPLGAPEPIDSFISRQFSGKIKTVLCASDLALLGLSLQEPHSYVTFGSVRLRPTDAKSTKPSDTGRPGFGYAVKLTGQTASIEFNPDSFEFVRRCRAQPRESEQSHPPELKSSRKEKVCWV